MSFNKTQLKTFEAIEKGIIHRDYYAHLFRFQHVFNIAKMEMKILDFGCGEGELYESLYRNKYKPLRFVGLDIRKKAIDKNKEKFPAAEWDKEDLTNMSKNYGNDFDIITSFEVAEHIGKQNGQKFIDNIASHCNENTIVLISTPCFNGSAARNHTYDSGDGKGIQPQEYTYQEMKDLVSTRFDIIEHFGTFASQSDYKDKMNEHQIWMYNELKKYYDSNLISILFAPMFPENSRNVIWKLKLK